MPPSDQDVHEPIPESRVLSCPGVRHGLLGLGWFCVTVGLAGVFVPLVPSTVFLLVGLWAFSRSSERFHQWLYTHPRLGRPLRDWHQHRLIPLPAKVLALAMMGLSLAFVTLFVAEDWLVPAALGAVLAVVSIYILTRPHRIAA